LKIADSSNLVHNSKHHKKARCTIKRSRSRSRSTVSMGLRAGSVRLDPGSKPYVFRKKFL